MSIGRLGIFLAASACGLSAADAALLTGSSPGFHYFWKQGATMEEHDADVVDCSVRLRAMVNGSDMTTGIAVAAGGGLLPALVGAVIDNNENHQGKAANLEGCMAIRGWSVVALGDEEAHAMEQPEDPPTIHAKLEPYLTAPAARGTVLRGPFANELAVGDFKVEKARDLEEVSFSRRALKDRIETAIASAGKLKPKKPDLPEGVKAPKKGKALKQAALAAAPAEQSYIVMRVVGAKSLWLNSTFVTFRRLTADGGEVVHDGATMMTETGLNKTNKGETANGKQYDYVIPVPSGRWKVAAVTNGAYAASLCLGAPAFDVGAGETVFVGEMTIRETGGYPIASDLAVAMQILAANPALAEKVKPAAWKNGYTSDCFGSYAYAYEIPGAPYVDEAALARAAATPAAPAMEDASETGSPSDENPSDTIASEAEAEE